MNWFEIKDINQLDSPVLTVFPERVKRNILTAIDMVGNVDRLRPHVKTHKSPEVTRLMMQAGITKFKCATIAEAEMLGQCGAKDVVLAYQPLGPKLRRFIDIIKNYPQTHYACLTDNELAAREQAQAFSSAGLIVPVYIDVNVGMNRTGITPGEKGVELYHLLTTFKGMRTAGLHAYDGHLRQQQLADRKIACDAGFQEVEKMMESLQAESLTVPNVIAGGSPAFPIHAQRAQVECSPGTFIYWDKTYGDLCPEQPFVPAAVLVTRVISLPGPGRICTDLGHKSVAAENEITRRIHFLNAHGLKPVGQSEEHLVLETSGPAEYKTGDVLYGIPYHVCPTVALYERMVTIEEGKVSGEWKNTARDRKLTI